MENNRRFHGNPPTEDEYKGIIKELELEGEYDIDLIKQKRETYGKNIKKIDSEVIFPYKIKYKAPEVEIDAGEPIIIDDKGKKYSCKVAYGNALVDLGERNTGKIVVFDNDLGGSVKTANFGKKFPEYYFQCGITEESTLGIASGVSMKGIVAVLSTFGKFGTAGRILAHIHNEQNRGSIKEIDTNLGWNVGKDGKTHHCDCYIGIMRNLYGYNILIPGDGNHTDHIVRHAIKTPGNFFVGMPRDDTPILYNEFGELIYGKDYKFEPGKCDLLRSGKDGSIFTMGVMTHRALDIRKRVLDEGYELAVYNMSCATVVHEKAIRDALKSGPIFTYEDHNWKTGLAGTLSFWLSTNQINWKYKKPPLKPFGIKGYAGSDNFEVLCENRGLGIKDVSDEIVDYLHM